MFHGNLLINMQLCIYDGFEGFYNGFTVLGET